MAKDESYLDTAAIEKIGSSAVAEDKKYSDGYIAVEQEVDNYCIASINPKTRRVLKT